MGLPWQLLLTPRCQGERLQNMTQEALGALWPTTLRSVGRVLHALKAPMVSMQLAPMPCELLRVLHIRGHGYSLQTKLLDVC